MVIKSQTYGLLVFSTNIIQYYKYLASYIIYYSIFLIGQRSIPLNNLASTKYYRTLLQREQFFLLPRRGVAYNENK